MHIDVDELIVCAVSNQTREALHPIGRKLLLISWLQRISFSTKTEEMTKNTLVAKILIVDEI